MRVTIFTFMAREFLVYNLEFNSKSTLDYSISVSDDLINWHNWKTESGNDSIHLNIFDPSVESITGLNNNSKFLF